MQVSKNLPDSKLVELVCAKDQELYAEVVERYQEKLLRYARYLIKDEQKAADVVQEAFIKAFVNLHGFNTKKKFSSWIYRIVHNVAINHLRKYHRESSLDGDVGLIEGLKDKVDIEAEYERQELVEKLFENLNKIPVTYREPLVLFYLEEKSYKEVSDILRMPVGTVGTRINRGKNYLAAIYEKEK